MKATKVGKLRCKVLQKDGRSFEVILSEVKFVPELWINLFSIGRALSNGFQIGNDGIIIHLKKGNIHLSFDKVMQAKKGYVLGVDMIPIHSEMAAGAQDSRKKFDINKMHQVLGHCGEDCLRLTAKANNWELTGKYNACVDCALGKAKQKNINKNWTGGSKVPGERLFIDISSIQGESYGGAKYWAFLLEFLTESQE
jgi:hypothetical protein